mmetsp:Transcript_25063/g.41289  ORF Transcript_25063/g.41289 Transcript_25063/m.41289 type:complete len:534 (-) Transcript_25063:349-1950(-)|eukprot:CAMPEP_0184649678 /NCGR_PEP_ID=MMETSP0308-20130426/7077_1 /TAXON_ID=38269 /ORGANISM="Gloeochaete witrockiana, Strain SAG 46.84" /LENGTH=533 /DNA_ID=CAMNT_0027082587 /DNA_START=418 /DNA_END=2019 /DNA_ORIENTATION=-
MHQRKKKVPETVVTPADKEKEEKKKPASPSADSVSWLNIPRNPIFSFSNPSALFGIFVLLAACYTRYREIAHPNEVVFDESHFGTFSNHYLKREFFFDIHPPLGKLILALTAKLGNAAYRGNFPFANNKGKYDDVVPYVWMRVVPATANVALCFIMYCVGRKMGLSFAMSFLAGCAVVFETSILVQCRLILIDSFLIFFLGLSLLVSFTLAPYGSSKTRPLFSNRYWFWLVLTGVCGGATASVKWTGLACLAGLLLHHGLICLVAVFQNFRKKTVLDLFVRPITILIVACLTYLVIQAIHFEVLSNTGPGAGMHSESFRASLSGEPKRPNVKKLGFLTKVYELSKVMFITNKKMVEPHPYQSRWWGWLYNRGGMFYWHQEGAPVKAEIFLMGNPIIYYLALGGVLTYLVVALFTFVLEYPLSAPSKRFLLNGIALFITYAGNILPYVPVIRSTFLYHYFPALLYGILLGCMTMDHLLRNRWLKPFQYVIVVALLARAAYLYNYFVPFLYGHPLTEDKRHPLMSQYYWVGGPEQ